MLLFWTWDGRFYRKQQNESMVAHPIVNMLHHQWQSWSSIKIWFVQVAFSHENIRLKLVFKWEVMIDVKTLRNSKFSTFKHGIVLAVLNMTAWDSVADEKWRTKWRKIGNLIQNTTIWICEYYKYILTSLGLPCNIFHHVILADKTHRATSF